MANEYTPEEITELKAREADEILRLGRVTDETRRSLMDMSIGVKGYTENLTKNFKSLGQSGINLAKNLNDGAIGASVFNESIGSLSKVIGDLVSLIPYVGGALKAVIRGTAEYTEAVNKQADALYGSYQEMQKIGATGAAGMSAVYDNLKKLNLGINELDKFVAIINENSQTLTSFSATVGTGLNEFAVITEQIQQSDVGRRFREMGYSVDEINKGVAGFIKMQTLTGGRQRMSTEQLIVASQNYLREVDLLAKVTGKTRQEQEAARESAFAEERYAAYKYELEQAAQLGDEVAKRQLAAAEGTQIMLDKMAPETRKGFLNILSGSLNNPEAQKLLLTMPEAAAVAGKKVFTEAEFQAAALKDITNNLKGGGLQLAKMGVNNDTFLSIQEQMKLKAYLEASTYDQRLATAKKDQVVTDQATKNMTDIQDANRQSRDALNDLINAGIVPVTTGMKGLATATDATINTMRSIAEKFGVETTRTRQGQQAQPAPARPPQYAPAPSTGGAAPPAPLTPRSAAPGGGAVDYSHLRVKSSESTAGGDAKQELILLATEIQKKLGGDLRYFSAFNDAYHQGLDRDSAHTRGSALDFTLTDPSKAAEVTEMVRGLPGVKKVLNEYAKLSRGGTGGHIHAEVGGYKFGGIATGPESGYETTLHGTEAVVPLPDGRTIPVEIAGSDQQMNIMSAQLNRLDDIVRVMQNQLSVSQKLLQYAQ